jgi:hypothetical protein
MRRAFALLACLFVIVGGTMATQPCTGSSCSQDKSHDNIHNKGDTVTGDTISDSYNTEIKNIKDVDVTKIKTETEDSFNTKIEDSYNSYTSTTDIKNFLTQISTTNTDQSTTIKDSYNTENSFNTVDSNNGNVYGLIVTDGNGNNVNVEATNIHLEGDTVTYIDASTHIQVTVNCDKIKEVKEPKTPPTPTNNGGSGDGGDTVISKQPVTMKKPDFDHKIGARIKLEFTTCDNVSVDCVTGLGNKPQRVQMWLHNDGDQAMKIKDWTPMVESKRITDNLINDVVIEPNGWYAVPEVVNLTSGVTVKMNTKEEVGTIQNYLIKTFTGVSTVTETAAELRAHGGSFIDQGYQKTDEPSSLLPDAVMNGAKNSAQRYELTMGIGNWEGPRKVAVVEA